MLRGPPPLGPGAPPAERAAAFLVGYLDRVRDDLPILLAVERARGGMRFDALYESYRRHLSLLAADARPTTRTSTSSSTPCWRPCRRTPTPTSAAAAWSTRRSARPPASSPAACSDPDRGTVQRMERLWAPWRLTYIEQASGDEPRPCVFCDKLERDDREALILHRGETAFCLLNLYPYSQRTSDGGAVPPHRAPRRPDAAERAEVWELLDHAIGALERAMSPHGFNVGMNLGRVPARASRATCTCTSCRAGTATRTSCRCSRTCA